eukprot:TRINITY_DN8915_c0_g1_i1.p1 TRINITY_DN8915_c0_g1~~TRINITY_DN8915_c0_g1_i1.p1  ORF type:complete len:109 (-),score=9.91 TRINITY_DN8915_c0_g1_i1:129-455(-)
MAYSAQAAYAMAAIVATGGLIGYVKAQSIPSLISGLAFGSLFSASGYLISNTAYPVRGHALAAVSSAILAYVMGKKAFITGNTVPSSIFAVSTLSTAFQLFNLYHDLQ